MKKRLPSFNKCFCCGEQNPHGLHAQFYVDGDEVVTSFIPQKDYCGYAGILHGGVTATLLDEIMTWAATVMEKRFYYAGEVKIRYKAPIPESEEVTIKARTIDKRKNLMLVQSVILNKENKVLAKGEGKYYPLSDSDDLAVKQTLKLYKDGYKF